MPGAEIRLIARNNEVLGTRTTDAQGHAAFDPGLARGEGGTGAEPRGRPGGRRLRLPRPQPRRLRPHRPRREGPGRDRRPRRLPVPGARGLPLRRDRADHRPPARSGRRGGAGPAADPRGQAAGRRRVPAGLGARSGARRPGAAAAAPVGRHARHVAGRPPTPTRRRPRIGETSFLVEDYVPERLEVSLKARQAALHRGEAAQVDVAARYLYGAPGADLDVSGSVVVQAAAASGIKGLEGYAIGLDDEAVEAVTQELQDRATTDRAGRRRRHGAGAPGGGPAGAGGEDHARGRRARRAGAVAQPHPADPAGRARSSPCARASRDASTTAALARLRRGAGDARRGAPRPAGGELDPVADRPVLPMVPGGRALVVRGGQDRPARRQRHRRPQGRRTGPDRGAGRARPLPAGGLGAGRRPRRARASASRSAGAGRRPPRRRTSST